MTFSTLRAVIRCLLIATTVPILSLQSGNLAAQAVGELSEDPSAGRIYTIEDFERFTPRNAMDMLNRVPGFAINNNNQGRGLGQAGTNVLINGKRVSSKSQNIFDQLQRLTPDNIERIEIVDGSTLDLPGLSGQVANVITRSGEINGQYEYRTIHRPKYAEPLWFGGRFSVSGSTESLEWNAAYNHGTGRGGAGGPGLITDANGTLLERREVRIKFVGDFPSLSGSMTWNGPDDMVANLNAQYSRNYNDFSNDEYRDIFDSVNTFRDFDNHGRGYGYEVGGDFEFNLGPGTLKLIGLERFDTNNFGQISQLIPDDDSPATGNRFLGESESGERIARSEYRWEMLGGDWEVDTEYAYNYLDQSSQFFNLEDNGNFEEVPLPTSTGEVSEDRYELWITHSRDLFEDVNLQFTFGGEDSELSQSGPRGLTREFWRNKGSVNLGWVPNDKYDISLNVSRQVGQLSFGDFLASVSLAFDNENAGNIQIRPTQTWETTLQIKRNWGDWGSTNLRFYNRQIDDYIELIPIEGGGESRGNIDEAELSGLNISSTINLDPMGGYWEGVRLDFNYTHETSEVVDQLSGVTRDFSGLWDKFGEISLRHDVPGTDWAWGIGANYNSVMTSYRMFQTSRDFEGPWYTFGFVEHKDVYGLTVNFNVFNMTDGRAILERSVWDGPRTDNILQFHESRDMSVQPIFRLRITGNF